MTFCTYLLYTGTKGLNLRHSIEKYFGRSSLFKAPGKSRIAFDNNIHRDGKDFLKSVIPGFAMRHGQFHLDLLV